MQKSITRAIWIGGALAASFGVAAAWHAGTAPERWSDAHTWGGTLPAPGATVRIARGRTSAEGGGRIELWGARRTAWLRLARTAAPGARVLDLEAAPDWAPGDRIAIAPSGFDALETGETANASGPPKPFEADFPIRGFEFYDGRVGVARTRFRNFVSNGVRRASALGALQFSPFFADPSNFAEAVSFENAEPVYFARHAGAADRLGADGYRATVFRDLDGSVSGTPGASVVLNTPMLADRDCAPHARWNALACRAEYASLFIVGLNAGNRSPGPVRVALAGGSAFITLYGNPTPDANATFQTNVRSARAYAITFARRFPQHLRIGVHELAAGQGLRLIFPQAPARTRVYEDGRAARGGTARRKRGALTVDLTSDASGDRVLDLVAPCAEAAGPASAGGACLGGQGQVDRLAQLFDRRFALVREAVDE